MRNCIFANARPGVPFIFDGGAERTTFALISGLARKGINVIQVCTFPRGDIELAAANANSMHMRYSRQSGKVDFLNEGLEANTSNEHLLIRDGLLSILAVHPAEFQSTCREIVAQEKTDLLVTWLKGSDVLVRLGSRFNVPTILRIVGPYSTEGYPAVDANTFILANSPVTAQLASDYYRQDVNFLLGIVEHASYVTERRTPSFITYVNPRKEKGIHLFCKIAALLPQLPFLVVGGWSRDALTVDEQQAMEFMSSLPNVTVVKPLQDMREVYAVSSLLLLPSRWQESWARVIGEAQANGIPVIASNRGSSPQNVGEGGVILDYGDPALWADVIRLLCSDCELRARLGDCGRRNVKRFEAAKLIEDYVEIFSRAAHGAQNISLRSQQGKVRIVFALRDSQGVPQLQRREIDMRPEFDSSEPAHP